MKEDIFLWGQFRERKQTSGLLLEAITYDKRTFFPHDVELTFLTVVGPVQPSDKRFLTVKGSRVDRHSSIIRLFPEDLGKCLTGEGRRGRVLHLGKYLFVFIYIIFFTIIVYILTSVLSARMGIHCIYDNGSPI